MKQLPLLQTARRPARIAWLQLKQKAVWVKITKVVLKATLSLRARPKLLQSFATRSDAAKWYVESHISALARELVLTYALLHTPPNSVPIGIADVNNHSSTSD